MENFNLNLEVSKLMIYETRDEKGPSPAERTQRDIMRVDGGINPIVAIVADVVWR